MPTFGENSTYELKDYDANHLKSLNERFVRWQDKQITLLTFSINLLFTLAVASIGLIISNSDKPVFKDKFINGCPLTQTASFIISLSAMIGIVALFSRLLDFRLTKNVIRARIFLFKVKNKLKYENSKQLNEIELLSKITKLTCWTKALGMLTWIFFFLQTLFFLTGILKTICNI